MQLLIERHEDPGKPDRVVLLNRVRTKAELENDIGFFQSSRIEIWSEPEINQATGRYRSRKVFSKAPGARRLTAIPKQL